MKNSYFVALCFMVFMGAKAQYGYRDSNMIGVTAGVNYFTLNTKDFDTKPGTGWNAGLSLRGNYYDDWDMVYGMQFSENNFSVATRNNLLRNEDVDLKMIAVQISLQLSYKLIENHLSFEFGPVVQFNGQLKSESDKETNTISGTTLKINDIEDISRFNVYAAAGVTTGIRNLRLNISYQYGFVNTLNKVETVSLKGKPGILNGNIIVYF